MEANAPTRLRTAGGVLAESPEELDLLVHPDNVAAIEVYPRPAQIPVQFKFLMRNGFCGVIAVWTRR